jgi:hypothetical protein
MADRPGLRCDNCGVVHDNPFSPIKVQAITWNSIKADKVPDVSWLEKRDYDFCSERCRTEWLDEQSARWERENSQS